ncbi:hypothetical protein AG1IA_09243 [Rhizoctonia solani AG-1 IA]|uniref:Uncharacterized protein n=1 Tax=Thanatephorus cucumeris (strain AG1-IA) TaxID=983506 RepID=L8WFI8_THACA|nr:hypothetical protein AG1IA_09243 [Rhizoctonia solani AG-1 IA]
MSTTILIKNKYIQRRSWLFISWLCINPQKNSRSRDAFVSPAPPPPSLLPLSKYHIIRFARAAVSASRPEPCRVTPSLIGIHPLGILRAHPSQSSYSPYSSSSSSLSSSFPAICKRDPHPSCNPPSIAFPAVGLATTVGALTVALELARDIPISPAPIASPATPLRTCIPTPPIPIPIPIPIAVAVAPPTRLENIPIPLVLFPPAGDKNPAPAVPESSPTP